MQTPAENQQGPLPDTAAEADRVAQAIQGSDATAVLIGGLAVRLRCPSASSPPLQREYKDIDLVTLRRMTTKLTSLLEGLGHIPDKRFNALQGRERLFFYDEKNGRQLDVFVDRFEMCHGFDLRDRVTADPAGTTLPLADLLLTKMQVVELNLKDMQDIAALLQDHPFAGDDASGINVDYITRLTRADWGLHHTIELTIEKLRDSETLAGLVSDQAAHSLAAQLGDLSRAIQEAPKSTGWKLRAKVGERKRWYELPEEART